jgi:hypothetical protein
MAQLWSEPISTRTISRGLKKIDFTRKSGQTPRRRQAFTPHSLVQGRQCGLSVNADQDKRIMDMKKEMKTEETNSKLK